MPGLNIEFRFISVPPNRNNSFVYLIRFVNVHDKGSIGKKKNRKVDREYKLPLFQFKTIWLFPFFYMPFSSLLFILILPLLPFSII